MSSDFLSASPNLSEGTTNSAKPFVLPIATQAFGISYIFGCIFGFIFLMVIVSIFCRRGNGGRFRPRRLRKNKRRVLYVFRDPNNPNNLIYCRYSKKTGRYKQVQYNLMVDQYAEVSTVQMQMNYDPNLNFAPPNYNQNTFNQPISSQTYIPQSPYGQQNYGQQNYGQQNYGQNNTGNNFYPNQQSPIYSPNLYGQTQQQDQFAPTISANGNNFAPSYNPPPVYGSQPY